MVFFFVAIVTNEIERSAAAVQLRELLHGRDVYGIENVLDRLGSGAGALSLIGLRPAPLYSEKELEALFGSVVAARQDDLMKFREQFSFEKFSLSRLPEGELKRHLSWRIGASDPNRYLEERFQLSNSLSEELAKLRETKRAALRQREQRDTFFRLAAADLKEDFQLDLAHSVEQALRDGLSIPQYPSGLFQNLPLLEGISESPTDLGKLRELLSESKSLRVRDDDSALNKLIENHKHSLRALIDEREGIRETLRQTDLEFSKVSAGRRAIREEFYWLSGLYLSSAVSASESSLGEFGWNTLRAIWDWVLGSRQEPAKFGPSLGELREFG
ncbi:MAG: hypothetical protein KDD64_11840 [Bdellovibrionales bacterium]|nr:hypothetical protein [Bdellovibrionales bacterium]